jgi:microcystin-dependent protein
MANKKISEFPSTTTPLVTDLLLINHSNSTYTTTLQSIKKLIFPVGAIFFTAALNTPTGFLECNGRSLSISDPLYTDLFAAIGYTYGGGGSNFCIPDLRGEFIRGWDHGRGIDSGRTMGSIQSDAVQDHSHADGMMWYAGWSTAYGSSGWGYGGECPQGHTSIGAVNAYSSKLSDNATNNNARSASETRPHNIAMIGIISY